jgi:hypothetical protein
MKTPKKLSANNATISRQKWDNFQEGPEFIPPLRKGCLNTGNVEG